MGFRVQAVAKNAVLRTSRIEARRMGDIIGSPGDSVNPKGVERV
jgi:hypothetical protein